MEQYPLNDHWRNQRRHLGSKALLFIALQVVHVYSHIRRKLLSKLLSLLCGIIQNQINDTEYVSFMQSRKRGYAISIVGVIMSGRQFNHHNPSAFRAPKHKQNMF